MTSSLCSNFFRHIIYADDTTLTGTLKAFTSSNSRTASSIISELDQISLWLNKLSLNSNKSYDIPYTPETLRIPELLNKQY